MSNGRLKAEYNRVRTSTALKGNDMWNNTIGVGEVGGGNTAIEATLRAPEMRGSGPASGRVAKQQAAKELIDASTYTSSVTNYEDLLALARTRGNIGNQTSRGACKICGGLGHLTKQCHNFISGHTANGDLSVGTVAAALAGGGAAAAPLLHDPVEGLSDLSGLSSSSSEEEDSGSEDSGAERKRRKAQKREKEDGKRKRSSSGSKHKKKSSDSEHRKEKKKSHKKSSSKAKKSRRE